PHREALRERGSGGERRAGDRRPRRPRRAGAGAAAEQRALAVLLAVAARGAPRRREEWRARERRLAPRAAHGGARDASRPRQQAIRERDELAGEAGEDLVPPGGDARRRAEHHLRLAVAARVEDALRRLVGVHGEAGQRGAELEPGILRPVSALEPGVAAAAGP